MSEKSHNEGRLTSAAQGRNVPPTAETAQAFDIFLLDCAARNHTPKTLTYYRDQVPPFIRWLAAEHDCTSLASITANMIRAYFIALRDRGLADASVHDAARAVRAWLNFCVREELLAETPMRRVRMPKPGKALMPALDVADVRRLEVAVSGSRRDTALLLFLLDTGVRASELCALHVGDVNPADGSVRVLQGKGRKDRVTFLGARAHKTLRRYLMERRGGQPNEPLFLSLSPASAGGHLTVSGLEKMLRRWGARAGVEHCHPHTFRRTCALWSLRAGMNIFILQQMMGHEDLTVLRRYLALVENDVREAHGAHGAVDHTL